MRSIGVLDFVRKEKRMAGAFRKSAVLLAFFLTAMGFALFPGYGHTAEQGGAVMRTPSSSGAVIGTDPETGTRVMQTPEPKEQESYQGPQTIIVAPEVYPGGRPGHGQSGNGQPGHGQPGSGQSGHGKPGHGKPGHGKPGRPHPPSPPR